MTGVALTWGIGSAPEQKYGIQGPATFHVFQGAYKGGTAKDHRADVYVVLCLVASHDPANALAGCHQIVNSLSLH